MQERHRPVMVRQSLAVLNARPGGVWVDCTAGEGGHAEALLRATAPRGRLIAMDRDPEAVDRLRRRLAAYGGRALVLHGNFREVDRLVRGVGVESVDGILMDLGVSLRQLLSPERGFGLAAAESLDMRMDPGAPGPTAADLVNRAPAGELGRILREYGEEPRWRSVVRAVVEARERAPIRSAAELARLVERQIPRRPGQRIHPATRTFQALRMAVNDELGALERGLEAALDLLAPGGRLAVISFHSLEDRMVKTFLAREEKGCVCPPDFPACACGRRPRVRRVTRRAVTPSAQEVRSNPSARSARLRGAERLGEAA